MAAKEVIKIVLTDDDAEDRLLFKEAIDELKVNTSLVLLNDGQELMKYLKENETNLPHILFLDLNMPLKSGLECLKEIRQDQKYKDITIAIYSTSSSERDIENTFIEGANVYIKKPNDFNTLKKVLLEAITKNWQYHTSGLNKETFFLSI